MKNESSTQIPGVQLADLPAATLTEILEDVNKKRQLLNNIIILRFKLTNYRKNW